MIPKERVEKLKKMVSEEDAIVLSALYNGAVKALKTYNSNPTERGMRDLKAAEEGLKEKVEALEAELAQDKEGPFLKDIMAVVRFLKDEGYKVGKSKVYKDRKAGLLKPAPDGSITESEALAYAVRAGLKKMSDSAGRLDDIMAEKAKAELAKLRAQEEKLRFELDRERGKYLPKADVRAELAMKIGAIEASVKHLLRTRGADYIWAVGGDGKKVQVFLDMFNKDFDELLRQMADCEELSIKIPIK